MATNNKYAVPYRRKREGKTDYKKRRKLLLGSTLRLVVRRSLKHFTLQLVEFQPTGDKVLITAHSKELEKHGWKGSTSNTSAAYLTGMLLAKKAGKKACVLDLGQQTSVKGSVLYAAVKGAQDGGLTINCAKEVIPNDKRIKGEHIADMAKTIKSDKERYEQRFSAYLKKGVPPEELPTHFEEVKAKLAP